MNARQIGLAAVLVSFTILTAEAVWTHGYAGFFETLLSSFAGVVAMTDLVIALTLILVWMTRDARQQGIAPLPYVVLTLALGSAGPLLYLIVREGRTAADRAAGAVKAAA